MIIGITGKSGSGKSTLALKITENVDNAIVLHIDKVGHEVLRYPEVIEEIKKKFGDNVIKEFCVDRKMLGDIVFASRMEMDKLTDITWNAMERVIDDFISVNKDKVIILDWLLLPKTKYFNMCDLKILVDVPYEVRLERAMLRDGISEEKFKLRDSASIDLTDYEFDVVINDVLKDDVRKLVLI